MGWVVGLIIGGIVGAIGGYLLSADLTMLTTVVGAAIGVNIGNRGRKARSDNTGEWYDGREDGDYDNASDANDDGADE